VIRSDFKINDPDDHNPRKPIITQWVPYTWGDMSKGKTGITNVDKQTTAIDKPTQVSVFYDKLEGYHL